MVSGDVVQQEEFQEFIYELNSEPPDPRPSEPPCDESL